MSDDTTKSAEDDVDVAFEDDDDAPAKGAKVSAPAKPAAKPLSPFPSRAAKPALGKPPPPPPRVPTVTKPTPAPTAASKPAIPAPKPAAPAGAKPATPTPAPISGGDAAVIAPMPVVGVGAAPGEAATAEPVVPTPISPVVARPAPAQTLMGLAVPKIPAAPAAAPAEEAKPEAPTDAAGAAPLDDANGEGDDDESGRESLLTAGGADAGAAYVPPTSLPKRTRTKTLDIEKVRLDPRIDPRMAKVTIDPALLEPPVEAPIKRKYDDEATQITRVPVVPDDDIDGPPSRRVDLMADERAVSHDAPAPVNETLTPTDPPPARGRRSPVVIGVACGLVAGGAIFALWLNFGREPASKAATTTPTAVAAVAPPPSAAPVASAAPTGAAPEPTASAAPSAEASAAPEASAEPAASTPPEPEVTAPPVHTAHPPVARPAWTGKRTPAPKSTAKKVYRPTGI